MVNSSRYISSDDGLKMQQQALAQTANASQQAVVSASEGVQAYLQGAVRNSQRLVELEQSKYAAQAQAASQPNKFTQLVQAGVEIAANIRDNERKEQAAKQKAQQEIQTTTRYAELNDKLASLRATFDSNNWNDGIEGWNTQAEKLLSEYVPKTPEEAKEWAKAAQFVADSRVRRGQQLQEKAQEIATETQNATANKVRSDMSLVLAPELAALANEGFTTNEQAAPRLKKINDYIQNFLTTDNGLPDYKKLTIASEYLTRMSEAYGKKLERFTEYQVSTRSMQAGVQKKLDVLRKHAEGKLGYEEAQAQLAQIEVEYPQTSKFTVKPGEAESIRLQALQMQQTRDSLLRQNATSAVNQIKLDDPSINSLAAAAFLDPYNFRKQQLENGHLKDIPGAQAALALADRLQKFNEDSSKRELTVAENRVNILRTSLVSLEEVVNFNKLLARQPDPSKLSPADRAKKEAYDRIFASRPELAALVNQAASGTLDRKAYEQAVLDWQAGVNQVTQEQQKVNDLIRQNLLKDYQDLVNRGLVNINTLSVDRNQLLKLKDSAPDTLNRLNQTFQRVQQEAIQSTQPSTGVQPNFNPSSSYAPVTDDNGKLRLVPRAQAQTIKVNGQQIVTPVIAGQVAPISAGGGFGAPRSYRNGTHYGLDFALPRGGKSIALVSGEVVHVGKANGYGNFVDILGDNGVIYRYGHQQSFVKVGQRVFPGQPVSTSDGSGVGAPHLHFEVRPNPQFTNGRYDIGKNYGQAGAIDPVQHLQKLNSGDSNVLSPRAYNRTYRSQPASKVPGNSTLTSNGGAIHANQYQQVGSVSSGSVQKRFSGQRPVRTGAMKSNVKVGQHEWDFGDDMGYAELREQPQLMKAFHQTAQRLGVPTEWIVDIARQESGSLNPFKDHNGNHYGLFGFGSDSFHDKSIHRKLRAGQVDGVGQLALYERYLRENGWDKIVKQKQGNVTIADLWAFTRMGWNDRQRFWKTGDMSIQASKSIPLTYKQELALLGKWVGRQYDFNSRQERNKPVSENYNPHCQICAQMQKSGSFAPHQHRN